MNPQKRQSIKNSIVKGLNELSDAIRKGEKITENFRMRKVVLDLEPFTYSSKDVRHVRSLLSLSQSLFANFLGVSLATIQAWEQDRYAPKDVACRFMDEIRSNPAYWRQRVSETLRIDDPKSKKVVN